MEIVVDLTLPNGIRRVLPSLAEYSVPSARVPAPELLEVAPPEVEEQLDFHEEWQGMPKSKPMIAALTEYLKVLGPQHVPLAEPITEPPSPMQERLASRTTRRPLLHRIAD